MSDLDERPGCSGLTMRTSFLCCVLTLSAFTKASLPPPCDSEIYCSGAILDQMQRAKFFTDDKHFVDMKLSAAPDVVLSSFHNLSAEFLNSTVPPAKLLDFLDQHFEEPGSELEPWTPPDWKDQPEFLTGIADDKLREWAGLIHNLWKSLGRKIRSDVKDHPELYSLIYTPHPMVVPGGRFRELYYWDSYWVINGLLVSGMTSTARGMIQNFLHLVSRYGFIPNGGRVYYERRSQPPFLTLMVESYFKATNDTDFLRAALPVLKVEYDFWMQNRSVALDVAGAEHRLNRFHAEAGLPRPESYTDDLELTEGLSEGLRDQLWAELKAGAESGWDFTSRWYIDAEGHNDGTLKDTRTSQILPVDLNALMCRTERTLASFCRLLGEDESAAAFQQATARRMKAMEAVLWDPDRGAWFDYSLVSKSKHLEFYASNLAPVWAQCFSLPEMGERAVQYLKESGALKFPNGVPTSLRESGQQWDYPNAWPPLQHMLIEGFSQLPSDEAKQLALGLAQRWIRTNWRAYTQYQAMFEKYDVNGDGKPGGGGEYEVQLGFGWTNGVALQLLQQYGASLTSAGSRSRSDLLLPLVFTAALMLH